VLETALLRIKIQRFKKTADKFVSEGFAPAKRHFLWAILTLLDILFALLALIKRRLGKLMKNGCSTKIASLEKTA